MLSSPFRLPYVMFTRDQLARYPSQRPFIVGIRVLWFFKRIFDLPWLDADIVCSRAKNHFDPNDTWDLGGSDDAASTADSQMAFDSLEKFQQGFKPPHSTQKTLMYFSVGSSHIFENGI